MRIDLHVHSTCSDGSLAPAELVKLAAESGVMAIALTDHDTAAGVDEAQKEGARLGVTVLPGIELSARWEGKEIHILGYCIQPDNQELARFLTAYLGKRSQRNQKTAELLMEKGLLDSPESIKKRYPGAVITRAHFAEYLYETGAASSVKDAFDRWLGDGKPCCVPKEMPAWEEAIHIIRLAGGHAVLAHPWLYRMNDNRLEQMIRELVGAGLEGLEAIYTTHTLSEEQKLRCLADRYGLHITGGSDFHGSKKPDIRLGFGRGRLYVDSDVMEWLIAPQTRG